MEDQPSLVYFRALEDQGICRVTISHVFDALNVGARNGGPRSPKGDSFGGFSVPRSLWGIAAPGALAKPILLGKDPFFEGHGIFTVVGMFVGF